jgi:hypothetical protein
MARKKKKLFAGVGAKCTVLTKFIQPKMAGFADDHRTTCILKEMGTIHVNRKDQECFIFETGGSPCISRKKSGGGSECI